jgi:hypothetical protein
MGKLSNTTSAVFEFIHDHTVQNVNGQRLHEFDIVKRFKPIIGHANTIDVLERLTKKHHLLKSTSTQKVSSGRSTYYYRANPDNPYYDTGVGRKASPDIMKKLEKLRDAPLGETYVEQEVAQTESPVDSLQTRATPESSNQTGVLSLVTGVSEQEGKDSVSLVLDLGNTRTEIVDVETAYKLYLGLKAVFGYK